MRWTAGAWRPSKVLLAALITDSAQEAASGSDEHEQQEDKERVLHNDPRRLKLAGTRLMLAYPGSRSHSAAASRSNIPSRSSLSETPCLDAVFEWDVADHRDSGANFAKNAEDERNTIH